MGLCVWMYGDEGGYKMTRITHVRILRREKEADEERGQAAAASAVKVKPLNTSSSSSTYLLFPQEL